MFFKLPPLSITPVKILRSLMFCGIKDLPKDNRGNLAIIRKSSVCKSTIRMGTVAKRQNLHFRIFDKNKFKQIETIFIHNEERTFDSIIYIGSNRYDFSLFIVFFIYLLKIIHFKSFP